MAADRRRPPKTESLTIRLDPKTRFILEFLARWNGQTITTVVERAVVKAASEIDAGDDFDRRIGWQELWDVSEGVRSLQMYELPRLFPTFEEERRLAFAREHWPFFWTDAGQKTFRRYSVDVLWPRIDEFIEIHEAQRAADYWAAGKAMADALRRASLAPPDWPIKPKVREDFSANLDDEIPF